VGKIHSADAEGFYSVSFHGIAVETTWTLSIPINCGLIATGVAYAVVTHH